MVATLAFAGCVPGEAEYTMKTSEVRKALAGKPARVRVHLKTETVLSNAYDKVAFGGGRYTNRLDCVQRYVERGFFGKGSPFNLGEKTSDRLKVRSACRPGFTIAALS